MEEGLRPFEWVGRHFGEGEEFGAAQCVCRELEPTWSEEID